MISRGPRNDNSENRRSGDFVVDVIARLRSIPKNRPRMIFMLKVAWISRFPGGTSARAGVVQGVRAGEKPVREPGPLLVSALRSGAVAVLAACVVFSLLAGLSVLARDSRPGDTLYAIKRARESVQLAFTLDPLSKARENLALAEKRLFELDRLVGSKSLTPDRVKYLADEYKRNKKRVEQVIAGGGADAGKLKAQLSFAESQKAIIAGKIASGAGAQSALVPASGARVTVRDTSGRPSLGNAGPSISGYANRDGDFGFFYLADGPGKSSSLEAVIELDGRKTAVPLCSSAARSTPAASSPDSGGRVGDNPVAVTAVVSQAGRGNRVELDNGLVKVVADGERPGELIKYLGPVNDAGLKVGPLEDPAVTEGSSLRKNPPVVRGPFLLSSSKVSAAYGVFYDLDYEGAKVHKSYEVELATGKTIVSISCKTSIETVAGGLPLTEAELAEVLQVKLPRQGEVKIAGKPQGQIKSGEPTFMDFDQVSPFATFNCFGRTALLAFPDVKPKAWRLDGGHLGVLFSSPSFGSGGESFATALLGFAPENEVASLVRPASRGNATVPVAQGAEGEGFDIECNPSPEELTPGRHAITLTIRKQYEKLSDYLK